GGGDRPTVFVDQHEISKRAAGVDAENNAHPRSSATISLPTVIGVPLSPRPATPGRHNCNVKVPDSSTAGWCWNSGMAASSKCAVKGGEGIGPERQDVAGEWRSACGKGRGIERGGGGACRVKLLYGGRSAKLARYMNGLGISRQIGEPQQPSLFASLVGQ